MSDIMKEKHVKKDTVLKGIGLHLLVYAVLAFVLGLIGVDPAIIFLIVMVLLWGLLVISYEYYYKK